MKSRKEQRQEIAISLLQGKLVLRERDGYDPSGFRRAELERTVGGALDMAEELLQQNERYGNPQEEYNEEVDFCPELG